MNGSRPHVSRETRLLLTIALVSVASLWLLARVRYPDRPATPNPVPPVLAPFVPPSPLDAIAAAVREVEPRLTPALLVLDRRFQPISGGGSGQGELTALRLRDDLAVVLLAPPDPKDRTRGKQGPVVARDGASGVALVAVPAAPAPPLVQWTAARRPTARFLIAAGGSPDGISFRPIFLGAFHAVSSALWESEVWALPSGSDLRPGTFVFTPDGAWAGLSATLDGRPVLVPAERVAAIGEQLIADRASRPGTLGVEVQSITPDLAGALGVDSGVIVTWVDQAGPAARALRVMDVIRELDRRPIDSKDAWSVRVARLTAGESVRARIQRGEELSDVELTAAEIVVPRQDRHGLTLRTRRGLGAEIVSVDPGSPAAEAGLEAGDLLTHVGTVATPSAAQTVRVLAETPPGASVVIALERAGSHRVIALQRSW
jgi:hypothetical protein